MGFHKYSYWLRGNEIISNRHREDNPKEQGDIYIGAWYIHEKTPYIEDSKVVRDYYKTKQVLMYLHDGSGAKK